MTTRIRHPLGTFMAGRTGATLALIGACLALGAPTASARNEFKNGFEDELGRIVAHRIATLGQTVLIRPVIVREEVYVERPRPRVVPRPGVWQPRPRAHFRPRHHFRQHHRPWRTWRGHRGHLHRRGWGHRHASTRFTGIQTREGSRRDFRKRGHRARWRGHRDRYGN